MISESLQPRVQCPPSCSAFWPLYRKELSAYFNTPLAYIVATAFLVITGYLFSQPLFLINQATIAPFVDLVPLLLTFFVPAISMRLLAEETKQGTIEVLLTFPVRDWEVLLSKFLAAGTLLCAVLASTAAYPISVGLLGRLDYGAVLGAYLGLVLTGALLAAAGLFASALTRNQVVAFIIAFLIGFTLYLIGKVDAFLPLSLGPAADFAGLDAHVGNLARGVLDSRDLLYYLTGIGLFLFLAQGRLWMGRAPRLWLNSSAAMALAAGIAVTANVLSHFLYLRTDLSAGRIYSVSSASRKLLRGLPDPVLVTVYSSKELPAQVAVSRNYLRDLLREYAGGSRGKLRVRFAEVGENPSDRDEAVKNGIAPVRFDIFSSDRFEQREGFLGLSLQYQDKRDVIAFLQDTSNLEYELTSRIKTLSSKSKPVLGFLRGHQALLPDSMDPSVQERLAARYEIEEVDLASLSADSGVPSGIGALFLLGPQDKLSDKELFLLDQHLLSGRSLAVAADMKRVDMRSFIAGELETGLGPFLGHHGLSPRPALVMDSQNQAIELAVRQGLFTFRNIVQYPPIVLSSDLNGAHPVTQGLEAAVLPFVSPIDVSTRGAAAVDVLVRSSKRSWARTTEKAGFMSLHPFQLPPMADEDARGPFVLAAAVRGNFSPYWSKPPAGANAKTFLSGAIKPGRLAVIGTSRFVSREFQPSESGHAFFFNLADWLSQDEDLISIRSKSVAFHPLRDIPASARTAVRVADTLGPPLCVAFFGVWSWRRRRGRRRRAVGEYVRISVDEAPVSAGRA